ncbi:MAG: DoxX family protein [Gemmatimonadota bacterium]|jgi:putative oxidoreductase|nr:DoxX family protein [Gemmatimonadota bacterium]
MIKSFLRIPTNSWNTDLGLLFLRIVAGLYLALIHGWSKIPPGQFTGMIQGMGLPGIVAWVVAFTELFGGLLIALGFLTRPASLVLVIQFLVVVLVAHAPDPVSQRELGLLYLTVSSLLLLAGPGRFSVDGILNRKSSPYQR